MGFGTVIANVVMFISVLMLSTGVIVIFKNIVEESSTSMQVQSDYLSNKMKTNYDITSAVYLNSTKESTISILNTGKTTLDLAYIDVYLDEFFVSRDPSNRTISIDTSTHLKNPGYWDANEVLIVKVMQELDNQSLHTVGITSQYGTKEEEMISWKAS